MWYLLACSALMFSVLFQVVVFGVLMQLLVLLLGWDVGWFWDNGLRTLEKNSIFTFKNHQNLCMYLIYTLLACA